MTSHLRPWLLAVLAAVLSACDLDIEPDKIPENDGVMPETPEQRRANEGLNLTSPANAMRKGMHFKDSRQVTMDRLDMTVMEGDEVTLTGSASVLYEFEREVEVLAPSIWKITMGKTGMTRTIRHQALEEPDVFHWAHPLSQEVIIRDGSRFSMEEAATDEQEEALENFQAAWFGGNSIFPDEPVRRSQDWAVKADVILAAIFEKSFTEASGNARLFVQQTLDFDGEKTAEVNVAIESCRGLTTDAEGYPLEIELHGFGKLYRNLDPLYTTQVDISGGAKLTLKRENETLNFAGQFECRGTSELSLP